MLRHSTWKDKYDNIVESFWKRWASFGKGGVEVVKEQVEQRPLPWSFVMIGMMSEKDNDGEGGDRSQSQRV